MKRTLGNLVTYVGALASLLPYLHEGGVAYAQSSPPVFSQFSAKLPTSGDGATTDWGDFDNDGDLDALVSGGMFYRSGSTSTGTAGNVRIFRNDGATFSDINAKLGSIDSGAKWADIDRDGRLDVVIAGTRFWWSSGRNGATSNYVGVLLQSTPNSFTEVKSASFGEWNPNAASSSKLPLSSLEAVVDINGDGWADMIGPVRTSTSSGSPGKSITSIPVCVNKGGTFSASTCSTYRVAVGAPVSFKVRPIFVDLNRDGRLDIVCGGNIILQTGPLRFLGNQSFTDINPESATTADINGDSVPDVVYSRAQQGSTEHRGVVFVNDTSGQLNRSADEIPLPFPFLAFGDIDQDGDADLVSFSKTQSTDNSRLLLNKGNNTWTQWPNIVPNQALKQVSWIDLDGDSDVDIQFQSLARPYNDSFVLSPLASVSGRTTRRGQGLNDVDLALSSSSETKTTRSNFLGRFAFSFLSPGTYSILPSKPGFTFMPTSRTITYDGTSIDQVDFQAIPFTPTPTPQPTPTFTPTTAPTKTPRPTSVATPIPTATPQSTKRPPSYYKPTPVCGNGLCDEDNVCSCPTDCSRFQWACRPYCGDGYCSSNETCSCSDCRSQFRCRGSGYYGSPY